MGFRDLIEKRKKKQAEAKEPVKIPKKPKVEVPDAKEVIPEATDDEWERFKNKYKRLEDEEKKRREGYEETKKKYK